MTVKEKLCYLKKRDGLTTGQLSEASGIPLGTLNKMLNGKTKRFSFTTMEKIAQVFHVPVEYLADENLSVEYTGQATVPGKESFPISEEEKKLLEVFRICSKSMRERIVRVISSLAKFQGYREDYGEMLLLPCLTFSQGKTESGELELSEVLVAKEARALEADFVVKVWDSALEPLYRPGQCLAVKHGDIKGNSLGVFLYNHQLFLRRLRKREGIVYLSALNRKIPPVKIPSEEKVEPLGVILGELQSIRWIH